MKKMIGFTRLERTLEILNEVKKTIDPVAFITGGFAACLYHGIYIDDETHDVDIFFKNPNFEDENVFNSFDLIEAIMGKFGDVSFCERGLYHYEKKVSSIANLEYDINNYYNEKKFDFAPDLFLKFNFIQYHSSLKRLDVLSSFDLDECKIILDTEWVMGFGTNPVLSPTNEFLEAWKVRDIKPNYDLHKKNKKLNEIQNEKTKKRMEKWSIRKNKYFDGIYLITN
jgi:hypothetical protein